MKYTTLRNYLVLFCALHYSIQLLSASSYQLRDALIPSEIYNTQISPTYIYSWPYTITTPGYYIFVNDIYMDSTINNQSAVSVAPGISDVIIDFNSYRITQHSTASIGNYGIYIAPGCHNITIRNGTISAISGAGIYIDTQTSNINIYNFDISSVQGSGIFSNGTNGFYCSDVSIDSIISTNNSSATGIYCNNSNTVLLNNCNISNTNSSSTNSYGMNFNNSTAIQVNGCIVDNTQTSGLSAFGCMFNNCAGAIVNNCSAVSVVNTSTTLNSSLVSPLLTTLTGVVNIQTLTALNTAVPSSTTGPINLAVGFGLNNSSNIMIKNSKVSRIIANAGIGYGIVTNNGNDNHFTYNEIIGNFGGINASGIGLLGTEKRSVVANSKLSGNIGTAGIGVGVYVSNLATYILVNNNTIINHNASANGIGIYDGLGALTTNRYFGNFLTNNTVGISFVSSNAPVFTGPMSSSPSTYQNTVL